MDKTRARSLNTNYSVEDLISDPTEGKKIIHHVSVGILPHNRCILYGFPISPIYYIQVAVFIDINIHNSIFLYY